MVLCFPFKDASALEAKMFEALDVLVEHQKSAGGQ